MAISMIYASAFLILAMSMIERVDSFVWRLPTTCLPIRKDLQTKPTRIQPTCSLEEFGHRLRTKPMTSSKHPQAGQERREVLALVGFTLGWTGVLTNSASWNVASALDDTDTTAASSQSSQFPLMDTSDTVFKSKSIEISWDANVQGRFNVDSVNTDGTSTGSQVRLSYQLPEKWKTSSTDKEQNYFDAEKQAKACNRITVYQAPAPVGEYTTMAALQKVSGKIGVAKALHMPEWLAKSVSSADLLSARKETKPSKNGQDEQTYLEMEMASAPTTCTTASENENDKLNLGLFCPYDTIYLVSATIVDGQLYVLVADASSEQWKRSNSDLKFVRSSFSVESL